MTPSSAFATLISMKQGEKMQKIVAKYVCDRPGGGGTLGISGWGCAAGSMEPLTFTRASSAEFCYPILE